MKPNRPAQLPDITSSRANPSFSYWSCDSETYAPADVLLDYLWNGWEPDILVDVTRVPCASGRCTEVYFFTLKCGDQAVYIPVVPTPIVFRLVDDYGLTIRSIAGAG